MIELWGRSHIICRMMGGEWVRISIYSVIIWERVLESVLYSTFACESASIVSAVYGKTVAKLRVTCRGLSEILRQCSCSTHVADLRHLYESDICCLPVPKQ